MSSVKSVCLCVLASFAIYSNASAETLNSAIQNATTSGVFRFGYIAVDPDVAGSTDTYASAVGGQIKLETASWNRLQFAIAPYFVEKISALSGDEEQGELNGDFFDQNGDSYAYLGEAYINYTWSNGSIRWGRQQIDTPFINTDNIRMLPHTYEAVWLKYNPLNNLFLEGGIATKWAGFASGGDPGKFKRIIDDNVIALGATYQMKDHHTFQGWYYDFDHVYSQFYTDAIYNNGKFEGGLQYSVYSEESNSGTDGTAWGLMAAYDFGVVKVGAAYNKTSNDPGKSVSVGLCGCGSFFTSLDEINIAGKTDASAYLLSLEYRASESLVLGILSGHYDDANLATTDIHERNFVLTYAMNSTIDAEYVYADVENRAMPADPDTNFSRHLFRVNYNF